MKRETSSVKISNLDIEKQKEFAQRVRDHSVINQKKYVIHTFGCQMNEHDSEKLAGMLMDMGYAESTSENEADMIVFNTCCVRENAEFKVIGNVGALKALKRKRPDMLIAVCGCMMQQEEVVNFISQKFKHVDIVFGTHNLHCFPQMVYNSLTNKVRVIDVWKNEGSIPENVAIERKDKYRAYVTIMNGCNNFCSYCIVPYVRGRERSRGFEDIINEVKELSLNGIREIMLLGQNVNSYGKDLVNGNTFAALLTELNKIHNILRIRFMTSHPKDLSDDLIKAISELPKVCNSLHLPFQSGSTKILRDMNRSYTKESYLELVAKIRHQIPNISLSTDIIVGFPGETEEDFADTMDVARIVRFDQAYTFMYSKRSGTPAATKENQVPEDIKNERFQRLLALQTQLCKEANDPYLRSIEMVFVEGYSKNNQERLAGRTESNKVVNFSGEGSLIGKLVEVKIQEVKTWSLEGEFIREIC